MAATLQARIWTGGAPGTPANAETGMTFNLADSLTDTTTPIAIPTVTGTNYSWLKNTGLFVTATSTTTINNRRISVSSALAAGLTLHWKDVAFASYAQAAVGNRPAGVGTNDTTPATYTLMTTTPALWDNTSVSTASSAINGDLCVIVAGVSFLYVGGAGTAISLNNLTYTYDEA